jgi:hypothetical protein
MAEDTGGWACSPRTRRSNHGKLREACKLLHCKYNSQTGISFDLADSSSSFGVPSGEHGAYGSSSESASSPDEPTGVHTQIEGGVNCDNRMLEQTSLVMGDTLIPHNMDSGVLAEQIVLTAKHFGSPEEDDKVFTKIESNRNERLRRGPKARMMASGKPLPRKACIIRPWRGPLPRPRSAARLTLEAFLTAHPNWTHKSVSSGGNKIISGVNAGGLSSPEESCAILPRTTCTSSSSCGWASKVGRGPQVNSSDSVLADLIKRAKAFGKPRSCLFRLHQGKVPWPVAADLKGANLSSHSPSYAKMAARPPAPASRSSEAAHHPFVPNSRLPGMAVSRQSDGWHGRPPPPRQGHGFGVQP